MIMNLKNPKIVAVVVAVLIVGTLFGYEFFRLKETETIKVATAGSLSLAFMDINEEFTKNRKIKVDYVSKGSVSIYRDLKELGKEYQIIGLADVTLAKKLYELGIVVAYTKFATNEIVLAYTENSKYSSEVNADNWYQVITRDDVKVGFSNPNMDPCGYRALAVMALADEYYGTNSIFMSIVENNTNVVLEKIGDEIHILVPEEFEVTNLEKLVVRDKSVDLESLLEAGEIDYVFLYKTAAKDLGFKFIELPKEINLGSLDYESNYSRVIVNLSGGETEVRISAIVYGFGITTYGVEDEAVREYVLFIYSDAGRSILEKHGFNILTPLFETKVEIQWLSEIQQQS